MAYSSNASYTSPTNLAGTDFSVTLSNKTHLAITFQIDPKTIMRRAMPALFIIPVILSAALIPILLIPTITLGNSHSSYPIEMIIPIFIVVMVVCMVGVMFGAMGASSKRFQTFQLELDKETNKMNLYVQNPYLRSRYQASYLARIGQYMTSAWDLDKVMFRLIMPGERLGPGTGILRKIFKNSWLFMYGDASWLRPNILFASENAELAQSLMSTIDAFLRDGTGFTDQHADGLLSERPYFP